MAEPSLTRRVDILEEKVEILSTLPDRMTAGFAALREEMRAGDAKLREALTAAIQAGDEETRRYMRVLHEDVIDRIKILGEAIERRPRKPRRS